MKIELSKLDRICFLGDSITADGRWIAEIFEHFRKNYPEKEIEFYNCGIGGTCGCDADLKNRLFIDCFNYFPKYVVIMFGMNDINRPLYAPDCQESDVEAKKAERIKMLFDGITDVIEKCREIGATPILCSPTPYDEYNEFEEPNLCCDKGLQLVSQKIADLSKEQNLLYIDMHTALMKHMDEKPIWYDRVHPTEYGYHLMAEHFLYAIGAKDKEEPDVPVEWCETNKKRFCEEQKIRSIYFLERAYMDWAKHPSLKISERLSILWQKVLDVSSIPQMGWVNENVQKYASSIDFYDEIRGEILRLTKEMYK